MLAPDLKKKHIIIISWLWQQELKKSARIGLFLRFSLKEFLAAIFKATAAIFVGLLKEIGWPSVESS